MATDLYNNLASPNNNGSFLTSAPINGQSFTNGPTNQVLSGLTVSLQRFTNTSGTLTAYLYGFDSATHGPTNNLGTIGSISNSAIPGVSSNVDIPVTGSFSLSANTSYYVILTDTASNNDIGFSFRTASPGEIGTAGTYFQGIGQPGVPQSRDANGYSFGARVTSNDPPPTPTPAPCYVTGTRIRVLRESAIRDVPVEQLRLADLAITASGKPRSIRWIGTRGYSGLTAPKHDRPVRVRAGALADCVPARDLLVSPDHCLWLDGLLVAAGHLVNGTSITRGEAVVDLIYWHVELDSHDLLLAEGAAAESFLAAPGVRAGFDGVGGEAIETEAAPYVQRTEQGPRLDALRRRLNARAGLSVETAQRFSIVRAWMDRCDGRRVAGWAQDLGYPDGPVCLDVVVDGVVVAMTLAEEYRADLAAVGIGDGRHGFDVDLDEPLAPGVAHTVEVRRSADGLRVCAMAVDAPGIWTPLLAA